MRYTISLGLLLMVVGGCEPDRSIGADVRSGNRLHARYWVAPSGAEILADWYDTELGVVCTPVEATDGTLRCLPSRAVGTSAAVSAPGPTITGTFDDAACTQRLYQWSSDCDPPAQVKVYEQNLCGATQAAVYDVNGEATPQALYGLDPTSGECVSRGGPLPDARFLSLGDARPPTDFVALEPQSAGGSGRLRQRFYRGSDGSRVPRDLYDSDLDTPCGLGRDVEGEPRCLPEAVNAHGFADAQCETPQPRWGQPDTSCAVPEHRYARTGSLQDCELRTRIYDLGPPVADVTAYVLNHEGTCEVDEPPPGSAGTVWSWPVTEELAAETFVPLQVHEAPGEGRLRLSTLQDEQGTVALTQLWDDTRQEMCRPALMADSTTRCVPLHQGTARDTYADSQCTVPAPSVWFHMTTACPDTVEDSYVVSSSDSCPRTIRLFEVGASLDGSPLYELNGADECVESLFTAQYALGAEIPASEFVELTLQQR